MAIYRYHHKECGFEQTLLLKNESREYVQMPCYRCGRTVTARQVRDKSVKIAEAQGTTGVLRREKPNK